MEPYYIVQYTTGLDLVWYLAGASVSSQEHKDAQHFTSREGAIEAANGIVWPHIKEVCIRRVTFTLVEKWKR